MPAAKGSACTPLGLIPKIVATFVYASSQGQRTHSARTKIPKIVATFVCASSQGQRTHSARTKILFSAVHWRILNSFLNRACPKYSKMQTNDGLKVDNYYVWFIMLISVWNYPGLRNYHQQFLAIIGYRSLCFEINNCHFFFFWIFLSNLDN